MDDIRRDANKILQSRSFFGELLSAFRREELVGEQRNALVVYIVATSRVLSKPLCLFIKGQSGAGKNFLTDTVLSFLPLSAVRQLTSSSTRSWNYLGSKLAHRVVYVKERNQSSGSAHPTRLLISEKELVHTVTIKKRGHFITERRVTKGPIASISTTTQDRVQVDDETRHISIWLDETPDQTTRIMEAAVEQQSRLTPSEKKAWQTVQKIIEKRAAYSIELPNWFKDVVPFVRNDNLWARRYFSAFVQACKTVALIRSFRRKETLEEKVLKVRFSDFAIAALIFNPVFERSIDQAGDEDLEIQQHVKRISSRNKGKGVCAADLADDMGISFDRAYSLLRKAASAGTIIRANRPSKGNLKLFLPANACPFLPDPAEMFQKLEGLPKRVKFVHPLSGQSVIYGRKRSGQDH